VRQVPGSDGHAARGSEHLALTVLEDDSERGLSGAARNSGQRQEPAKSSASAFPSMSTVGDMTCTAQSSAARRRSPR